MAAARKRQKGSVAQSRTGVHTDRTGQMVRRERSLSERLLDLQRLAGNTAVAAAVGAARSPGDAPAAGVAEPAPRPVDARSLPDPAAGSAEVTVQRKVGFEFEAEEWNPWRRRRSPRAGGGPGSATGGRDVVEPVGRKGVLDTNRHFTLQADDMGPARSDLEFVTDPFDETPDGLAQLDEALDGMIGVARRLTAVHGRPGPAGGRPPYPISVPTLAKDFVLPAEHGLSGSAAVARDDLLLSGGVVEFFVKMQSTAGMPLADLPKLMERLGHDVPNETPEEAAARAPHRETVHSSERPPEPDLMVVGAAPTVARYVVEDLRDHRDFEAALAGDNQDLTGFIAALANCLGLLARPGRVNPDWGIELVKERLGLLHRNDFVQMFDALPAQQRVAVRSAVDSFVDTLLAEANQYIFTRTVRQGSPLLGRRRNDPPSALHRLTVGEWIKGITVGMDHLSRAGMARWLDGKVGAAEKAGAVDSLESVGALGTVDRRGPGATRLFQFENRMIEPGAQMVGDTLEPALLTIEEAAANARRIFEFYVELREGRGV